MTALPLWFKHLDKEIDELKRFLRVKVPNESVCPKCRGVKLLCGRKTCPVILQFYSILDFKKFSDINEISGNSPPSIFVGRYGYPRVEIGPMVPPIKGDTAIYDFPEKWTNLSLMDILRFRSALIHGRLKADVRKPWKLGRNYDLILDLALSRNSPEVEMRFSKKPTKTLVITEEIIPFGPTAPVKSMKLGSFKIDHELDKCFADLDLKASDAVVELYKGGVPISSIQRAFSVGALGVKGSRRIVPTRWSITAVDSIISKWLIDKIKEYPSINEFHVYEHRNFDNLFIALLIPGKWSYEWLEAWFPGTFWNKFGIRAVIYSDYERFKGRKCYAENTGGCYYAARLAVAEKLYSLKRQAIAILFREVYEGYLFPIGVWNVRENYRRAFKGRPKKFESLKKALNHVMKKLRIPLSRWAEKSTLLHELFYQRKITEF